MHRRDAIEAALAVWAVRRLVPLEPTVATLIGTSTPGDSDRQVNNAYGFVFGPDGALYFCDLDDQRIGRLDGATGRITTYAGTGAVGATPVALLAGASTIPSARGRGAQRALLNARLLHAAAQGVDLAMIVTQPESGSQRNAERAGFRPVYSRSKWERPHSVAGAMPEGCDPA
jgi:hypothetical protein